MPVKLPSSSRLRSSPWRSASTDTPPSCGSATGSLSAGGLLRHLAVFVVQHADLHYVATDAPHGTALWAAAYVGLTIIASGPLSWGSGAVPPAIAETTRRRNGCWTRRRLRCAVLLGALGVLAGTAVDMTDPQSALAAIFLAGSYPVFLLAIVVGSITNNVSPPTARLAGRQRQGQPGVHRLHRRCRRCLAGAVRPVRLQLHGDREQHPRASVSLLGPSPAIYGMTSSCGATATARCCTTSRPAARSGIATASTGVESPPRSSAPLALLCVNTTIF